MTQGQKSNNRSLEGNTTSAGTWVRLIDLIPRRCGNYRLNIKDKWRANFATREDASLNPHTPFSPDSECDRTDGGRPYR